jgi:hypothetical protein
MSSNVISLISIALSVVAVVIGAILTIRQSTLQEGANVLATIDLFREWRSREFKESYEYVLTKLATSSQPGNGFAFSGEARIHAVRISHYLDNLGLLVYFKAVRRDLVLAFIGGSVLNCWKALSPYIYAERQKRSGGYQEFFEHLAALAQREHGSGMYTNLQKMKSDDPKEMNSYVTPA